MSQQNEGITYSSVAAYDLSSGHTETCLTMPLRYPTLGLASNGVVGWPPCEYIIDCLSNLLTSVSRLQVSHLLSKPAKRIAYLQLVGLFVHYSEPL